MKKINKGFSLAEVLISVGIASVIATLGFSVVKRNLDQAYNGYIFNGLNSIQMALKDAKARNIAYADEIVNHIKWLMNAEDDQSNFIINAPNGITYEFGKFGTYGDGELKLAFIIRMTVPQRKNNS